MKIVQVVKSYSRNHTQNYKPNLFIFETNLENKPEQLSEVVVISENNKRLRFLESHLKSIKLSYQDEIIIHTLIQEAEGGFKKMEDNESEKMNEIEENEECHEIICKFFIKGTCRFGERCFNSHNVAQRECDSKDVGSSQNVLELTDENAAGNPNSKSHSKQKKNNKITAGETPTCNKKPPMKTATDVINRIQWDEKLHPEDFTVGYLDRFLGVIENSYSSFNWEDITLVDESILAIPRHRIQYFKYHDEIVWNKNNRLDTVFGSTGSKQTILDIIEKPEHKEVLEN